VSRRLGSNDVRDTDDGVMLTMTARTLGVLTTTLLEGDDLLAAIVFDNFSLNGCACNERCAELCVSANADHENFGEFYSCASVCFQLFDSQNVVGRYAVLLTAGLDDCEHFLSFHVRSGSARKCGLAVFLSVEVAEILRDFASEMSASEPRFFKAKGIEDAIRHQFGCGIRDSPDYVKVESP
jgi:hypothetical protein